MSAKEVIAQLKSFSSDSRKKSNKTYFKTISFNEIGKLINHAIHEIRYCGLSISSRQQNSSL